MRDLFAISYIFCRCERSVNLAPVTEEVLVEFVDIAHKWFK
jgi:hypothetical protein